MLLMMMLMLMMMMMMMVVVVVVVVVMMMVVMIMLMLLLMMMIVMIALKGVMRDYYNLLTAPRISNTHDRLAWAQSCANPVQDIARLSRATCHVPRGTKGQLCYYV